MGETVRQYQLDGLKNIEDAIKIEEELKKVTQLEQVRVDYLNSTLNVSNKRISKSLLVKIKTIVKMIDEDIFIHRKRQKGFILSTVLFVISLLLFALFYFFKTQTLLSTVLFTTSIFTGLILLFYPQENSFSPFSYWQERIFVGIAVVILFLLKQPALSIVILSLTNFMHLIEGILYHFLHKSNISTAESFQFANIKQENHIVRVPAKDVQVDDIIYVKPGERIPVDGIIIDGKSHVMYDILNPQEKAVTTHLHMEVYGGMMNKDGVIAIQVTKDFAHSKWIQMEEFMRDFETAHPKTLQRIKTCLFAYKTIIWLFILFVIGILIFFPQENFSYLFLCSLFLLSHLGFLGDFLLLYWNTEWNHLKRSGIFVRGIEPLDLLSRMKHVIFDLEHTLTYGRDIVAKIVNHTRYTDEELLYYVACAEEYSINSVALAIKHSYGKRINTSILSNYQELSGLGVKVDVEKQTVLVGNEGLLTKFGVWVEEPPTEIGTVLHIAIDKEYAGYIVVRDELKPDISTCLQHCRKGGLQHITVVSSEAGNFVAMVCQQLGISEHLSHLTLSDKNRALERYRFQEKKLFTFVSSNQKLLADHHADLNIMIKNLEDDFCHDTEILIHSVKDLETVKRTANRLRKRSWLGTILFLFLQICLLLLLCFGKLPIYVIPMVGMIYDIYFLIIILSKKGA